MSRAEAMRGLAERTDVAELRHFVLAVRQAETYGIPIAQVLRVQAAELRVKRRQRAEEQAMKLPVKVIFPLVLCILPAIFIVVLGPAAHPRRRQHRPVSASPLVNLEGLPRGARPWPPASPRSTRRSHGPTATRSLPHRLPTRSTACSAAGSSPVASRCSAARPAEGKTVAALQWARQAAIDGAQQHLRVLRAPRAHAPGPPARRRGGRARRGREALVDAVRSRRLRAPPQGSCRRRVRRGRARRPPTRSSPRPSSSRSPTPTASCCVRVEPGRRRGAVHRR